VFELKTANNSMTSDLAKLRRKEQQWRHEKQLSVIGQVAARVAHDINNPLTVIRNTVRLMQRRTPAGDTQAADDLALVHHHCERAIRIVENLLHYGRPVKVRLSRLDLVDFCSERATEWSKRSGATVRFEADHRPLWVDADPFQLEQLLENLLDNARQAAPDATITLTCGRRGSLIYLSIADGGPGFSDEARAHLFEPFFTTKDGGSGLGLANSLSIARAHGGTIEIGGQQRGEVILLLPGESERI
jgi:signal transduction histidine kinase